VIVREFNICALGADHAVSKTAAQDGSGIAARTVKPSSGKKYHQPISFSFADIMEKVIDVDFVCMLSLEVNIADLVYH